MWCSGHGDGPRTRDGVGDVDTLFLFSPSKSQVCINRCLKVAGYGFYTALSTRHHRVTTVVSTQHRARRHEHTNKQALNTREDKRHSSVQSRTSSPGASAAGASAAGAPAAGAPAAGAPAAGASAAGAPAAGAPAAGALGAGTASESPMTARPLSQLVSIAQQPLKQRDSHMIRNSTSRT